MNRIISKEEEREDPRRELQSIFEYSGVSTNTTKSTRSPVFPHAIQQLQVILHTESILPQENSKRYKNYKAHPIQIVRRHPPATAPCVSKHSTWQNKAPSTPTAFQSISNNSTQEKQHSVRQAASTHSLQQFPGKLHLVLQE